MHLIFPTCPLQEILGKILSDYELIEECFYCLSNEDVKKK